MHAREVVTFTLPSGARVTAPIETAKRLGWQPPAEPKRTRKK